MSNKLKIAILVGSAIDQSRREAAQRGEKPRIDVLEMQKRFDCKLYDYQWLQERVREEWLTWILFVVIGRFLGWSWIVVLRAFPEIYNLDVIYTTGEDLGLPLAIVLRLLRKKRPKIIMRLEQTMFGRTRLRRRIYSIYLRFAMRRVDLTVCRVGRNAQLLQRALRLPEEAFSVAPEPVDITYFNNSSPVLSTVVDIPTGPYIVSAGLEMRDYVTLIEAVKDLPVQLIIGAGSPWSKFRFNANTTLPDNVLASTFTPAQMRELYRSATLVAIAVRHSRRACGMNVVLEAWAMGRPVVATKTIGLSHYIRDGETGIFAQAQNSADLRAKILYLLEHTEEARKLGNNGREGVERSFYLDNYVEKMASLANKVSQQPS